MAGILTEKLLTGSEGLFDLGCRGMGGILTEKLLTGSEGLFDLSWRVYLGVFLAEEGGGG